jgi:hypothetical protein
MHADPLDLISATHRWSVNQTGICSAVSPDLPRTARKAVDLREVWIDSVVPDESITTVSGRQS